MKTNFHTLILSLLVLTSCNFFENQKQCLAVKDGRFFIKSSNKKASGDYVIIRQDTIQTEIDITNNDTTVTTIKWTSPCTYEMKLKRTTMKASEASLKVRKTIPLIVDILSVKNSYYVYIARRKNSPVIMDTVWFDK